jgi:hypothetical protein
MSVLFRPSQLAFKNALDQGVLVLVKGHSMYVGNYMYMHTDFDAKQNVYIDAFKHVEMRFYIYVFNQTAPHIDALKCCPDDPEGIEAARR